MKDNIISFEEFRKKKYGSNYKEDIFTEIFKKDIREQPELLDWYLFHQAFNKHKLFIHTLFYENSRSEKNPNAGFVVSFDEKQIEFNTNQILEAIKWEGSTPILLDAKDKTYIELGQQLTGIKYRENYDVNQAFRQELLHSDKMLVIKEISKLKTNRKKVHLPRYLIKINDDAHFDKIVPRSGLIFVDYADFLQKVWANIGIYLNVLS